VGVLSVKLELVTFDATKTVQLSVYENTRETEPLAKVEVKQAALPDVSDPEELADLCEIYAEMLRLLAGTEAVN